MCLDLIRFQLSCMWVDLRSFPEIQTEADRLNDAVRARSWTDDRLLSSFPNIAVYYTALALSCWILHKCMTPKRCCQKHQERCSGRDRNSRCDGEIGSRQWADFSHLLSFLQSNLLTGSLLFLLLILRKQIKKEIRSERRMKRESVETQMSEIDTLHFEMVNRQTLVSSCALAKLSTAMAKNTFSRVSEHRVNSKPVLFVHEHTACP